jgi:hypothetical protein
VLIPSPSSGCLARPRALAQAAGLWFVDVNKGTMWM